MVFPILRYLLKEESLTEFRGVRYIQINMSLISSEREHNAVKWALPSVTLGMTSSHRDTESLTELFHLCISHLNKLKLQVGSGASNCQLPLIAL